jgi:hypothetical protein
MIVTMRMGVWEGDWGRVQGYLAKWTCFAVKSRKNKSVVQGNHTIWEIPKLPGHYAISPIFNVTSS